MIKRVSPKYFNIPKGIPLHCVVPNENLDPVLVVRDSTCLAFDRIFGSSMPHDGLLQLVRFNEKILTWKFQNEVESVLGKKDLEYFYSDPEDMEKVAAQRREDGMGESVLLQHWQDGSVYPDPHHLLPTSRWGSYGERNIRYVDKDIHSHFHTIFRNLTPSEQVFHLFAILGQHWNARFISDLCSLLLQSDLYYYDQNVIRPYQLDLTLNLRAQ